MINILKIHFLYFCIFYLTTMKASKAQIVVSKSVSFGANIKDIIRNERFEDLISEVLVGEAPVNDFIIHYDSTSSEFFDAVVKKTNAKKEMNVKVNRAMFSVNASHKAITLMINYDTIKETESAVWNPSMRATIHIVSLKTPLKFDEMYSNFLKPFDVIIFICQRHYGSCKEGFEKGSNVNALEPVFLKNSQFLKKVRLMVVIEVADYRIRLYELCFYCGVKAEILIQKNEIDFLTAISSKDIDLYSALIEIFRLKTFNFNSHVFRIMFPYSEMNFGCQNPKETISDRFEAKVVICEKLYGIEGLMLHEIEKRLNLKAELLTFNLVNEDDFAENFIAFIHEQRAEVAVGGITVTSSRTKRVQFSFPVSEDPVKIIYTTEKSFFKDGLVLLRVFSISTWIVIVFSLLAQSCVVYLINRDSHQRNDTISKIIWVVGFTLTEQSLRINWRSFGGRVLILWLLSSNIISTFFKAQLTSFITKPPENPLSNFDKLVSGGFELNLISSRTRFISQMLNSSSDKSLQELSHRVKPRKDMCATFKEIIGKKEMMIDEMDNMYKELNKKCRRVLTYEDMLSLRVTRDDIFPSTHAWAFPKKAPFFSFINDLIILFHQNGLQKKWSESLTIPPRNHSVYFDGISIVDQRNLSPNKMKFYGQFVMWIFGIGFSGFCFIIEVLLNKLQILKKNEKIGRFESKTKIDSHDKTFIPNL